MVPQRPPDSPMTSTATLRVHRGRRSSPGMRTESRCDCIRRRLPGVSGFQSLYQAKEIGRSLAIGPHDAVLRRHRAWMSTSAATYGLQLVSRSYHQGATGSPRFLLRGLSLATEVLALPLLQPATPRAESPSHFLIPLGRKSPFANCHLQLWLFNKSHRLNPTAPTSYPLHHFWYRLYCEFFGGRSKCKEMGTPP